MPNAARLVSRPARLAALAALPVAALMVGATLAAAPPSRKTAKPAAAAASANQEAGFARDVAPFVKTYCAGCHAGDKPAGDLALDGYATAAAVLKARRVWEKVSSSVATSHMPPEGMPQPKQNERDRFVAWIESAASQADCNLNDPGRVTMRRLNREEYNNTIRDLVGVDMHPADDFPSDDVGYGFDNIGDVLSISPLLMEKYLRAAQKIAETAIVSPEQQAEAVLPVRYEGGKLRGAGGAPYKNGDGRILTSAGEVGVFHDFVRPGKYVLRAEAFGQQAGSDPCRMVFRLDGTETGRAVDVPATEDRPKEYEVAVTIPAAGRRRIAVAFVNDYFNGSAPDPQNRDRNLIVNALAVQGPLGAAATVAALPESHRRILFAQPKNEKDRLPAAKKILRRFAARAWRRPVTEAELGRLLTLVQRTDAAGESFERGIQLAVQAVLVSPKFLFRVEMDPRRDDPHAKRALNDYELASRLSYFLWSSLPDDELFALAAKKQLGKPDVLAAQVRRMLKNPRARTLADNFAGQWLQLRKLKVVNPDPQTFAGWNDDLRDAMRQETSLFFQNVVREDRPVLDFLDARYTFLNETLARHYGISGVSGPKFRRVALTDPARGGVLTQASVLTVTSNPTRTSPVKRGKWVLDNLLGTPPPPAPPGAGELPDDKKHGPLTGTLRQRLEQHRANPACASCHQRMDPIGFGLENFDAVGAWRKKDGDAAVDASGTLPGGKSFSGPAELKTVLLAKKDQFTRNLAERLLTYALGRGIEPTDRCNLDALAKQTAGKNYKFSALVTAIVQSDPFRLRRGDGAPVSSPTQKTAQAR